MIIQIGQTVEKNGLRFHRYAYSFEVTELANAGKRGKQVRRFEIHSDPCNHAKCARLNDIIYDASDATTYDAAVEIARACNTLEVRETVLRAIDVLPAADAPLTATFRANGIQVGGALVRGWFSYSDAWTDRDGTGHPAHVTFYSHSLRSDLLRRIFPGEVENNSDSMTDYFEEDKVRFGADHPRYAEALLAVAARKEQAERRAARRQAKHAAA
jgi:hypothetical protein